MAEDILGGGVIDNLQTTMTLTDTSITGSGGCNRHNGSASILGMALTLGPGAATRMACLTEAANNQEVKFFDALSHAAQWRIENDILFLSDPDGADVLRFSRLEN